MKRQRYQKGLIPVAIVILVSVSLIAIVWFWHLKSTGFIPSLVPTSTDTGSGQMGTVKGVVSFIGSPCVSKAISHAVPPCDGVYPNYEVKIYDTDGKIVIKTTKTDAQGMYAVQLSPGKYVINTPKGLSNYSSPTMQSRQLIVTPGNTTNLNLSIDTGIR